MILLGHGEVLWDPDRELLVDVFCCHGQASFSLARSMERCPVDTDYPLGGVLSELAASEIASFSPLVSLLTEWRDALGRGEVNQR
jgi:hypothetical protein